MRTIKTAAARNPSSSKMREWETALTGARCSLAKATSTLDGANVVPSATPSSPPAPKQRFLQITGSKGILVFYPSTIGCTPQSDTRETPKELFNVRQGYRILIM